MIQIKVSIMNSLRNIAAKTYLCEIEEAKLVKGLDSSGLSRSEYIRRKILGTGEMVDIYRTLVEIRDLLKANRMDDAHTLLLDIAKVIIGSNRFKQ
jgi:hypothetical protein